MEIPDGYIRCPGDRAPSVSLWGERVYCFLRCGVVAKEPWPIKTTRWVHDGTAGDVIAIRKEEDAK